MKRVTTSRTLALILLALLLVSGVLAQSGGTYDLSWSVDSGGAIFSDGGSYSLGGTIGQPDAGQLSGGRYVLSGGFFGGSSVEPPSSAVYLPLLAREPTPTPNPPVPCNEHEDNAGKDKANPFPGLGKTCYGDFNTPSNDEDDWYSIGLTAGQRINVLLSRMPPGDDYDPYLYLPDGITHGGESHNQGNADDMFTYLVPTTGTYYIHLHAFDRNASSHTYYLSITVQ